MAVKRDVLEINVRSWKNQQICFHKRIAVLTGHANTGKSYLLKVLFKELKTNTNKLRWNQVPIANDQFNPIFMHDQLLLDEDLKIGRKSYLKYQLMAYINHKIDSNEKFKNLKEHFENFKRILNEIINTNFLSVVKNDSGDHLQALINDTQIETYLEKTMSIKVASETDFIATDAYSIDYLKQLWFMFLIKTRASVTHQQNFLLLDDITSNLSPLTWLFFIEQIKQLVSTGRWYVLLVCKNPLFLKFLKPHLASLNFITHDYHIKAIAQEKLLQHFICLKSFFMQKPMKLSFSYIEQHLPAVLQTVDYQQEYSWVQKHFWKVMLIISLSTKPIILEARWSGAKKALVAAGIQALGLHLSNDEILYKTQF